MSQLAPRRGIARYEADEYYREALEIFSAPRSKVEAAIATIDRAIQRFPRHSEYLAARGLFYLTAFLEASRDTQASKEYQEKAEADFLRALKANPMEMLAFYGRGVIAYQTGNLDEAKAHFTDAYKLAPQRPETLYYLALVYHRKQENPAALRLMQMGLGTLPADDKRRSQFEKWISELERLLRGGR